MNSLSSSSSEINHCSIISCYKDIGDNLGDYCEECKEWYCNNHKNNIYNNKCNNCHNKIDLNIDQTNWLMENEKFKLSDWYYDQDKREIQNKINKLEEIKSVQIKIISLRGKLTTLEDKYIQLHTEYTS